MNIPNDYKEMIKWKRTYRETLIMAFEASVYKVMPNEKIIIGHSLGDGYYFYFENRETINDDEIDKISKTLKSYVENDTKIEHVTYEYKDALEILKKRGLNDAYLLVKTNAWEKVRFFKIDDYLTLEHSTKVFPSLSPLKVWEIKKYKGGLLLRYPRQENFEKIGEWKDNPELFKAFNTYIEDGRILDLYGVGKLNEIIRSGNISDYISISESLQRRKILEIADEIHKRKGVKYVFVAGPSSSNKTTFATKLCLDLKTYGYEPIQISLDDYYFTKDKVPRNELGEVDLECLEAIDTELFREHLNDLYDGKDVYLPHFEFNINGIGRRTFNPKPIHLHKKTILVIEGLHALNNKLSEGIKKDIMFRIYISALTVLNIDEHTRVRTTDNRIIRRLVRDARSRHAPAFETLEMWNNVERGEKKYIFPFQNDVDAVMNSAEDYELSVLRVYAEPLLKEITPDDKDNYPVAKRLLGILSLFDPLDSRLVPSDSMLREFIG